MVLPHGNGDLYHKYRPRRFNEIVGHKEIIGSKKRAVLAKEPAQSFLLIGSSGTGKTTTARIMALALNCDNLIEGEPCLECIKCKTILTSKCTDIIEVNAADNRGIQDIRNLCQNMPLMPLHLRNKVYILDEAQGVTGEGQSSLLKELEEAPKHVFIILCSTHPEKILPTVRNRCQKFTFKSLKNSEITNLIEDVIALEGKELSKEVIHAIVNESEGSARQALVILQQVLQSESKNISELMMLISGEDVSQDIFKLCFELLKNPRWSSITGIYSNVSHMGAPSIGMTLAGFFRNKLLKASSFSEASKISKILELFVVPFSAGKLGENQLVSALFKAFEITRTSNN